MPLVSRGHADPVESVRRLLLGGCSTGSTSPSSPSSWSTSSAASPWTKRGRIARHDHADLPVAGGIGAGTASDWGRGLDVDPGLPFSFLGGFSTSFRCCSRSAAVRDRHGRRLGRGHAAHPRALAGAPARHRVRADAERLLDGVSAVSLAFEFVYPRVNHGTDLGWRDADRDPPGLPRVLHHEGVKESPVWLERQRHRGGSNRLTVAAAAVQARFDLTTLHTSLLMGAFLFIPLDHLLVSHADHADAPADAAVLAALNIGGITRGSRSDGSRKAGSAGAARRRSRP